jgi:hypothetical protein
MIIIAIHATDGEYTETECAAVEDIVEAKLVQHLADRARYIRPKDSSIRPTVPEAMAHAGSVPLEKPAFFREEDELEPAKTWVAFDLTLRCSACGSTVEKCGGKFYCNSCERRAAHKRGGR